MDTSIVRMTLILIVPGIISVFGVTFFCVWLLERRFVYLLFLSAANFLFSLGAASQVLYFPPDDGLNAVLSGALYTGASLCLVHGILRRSDKSLGLIANIILFSIITSLIWYFFFVDRQLLVRVYVQSFGYGTLLLIAAYRLRHLASGRYTDRVLFWMLFVFGLQFFPRTLLTIGFSAPADRTAFANSVFWQGLQLSLAVLGAGLAMAILAAAITDILDDLRRERDVDLLTGVLSRRGLEARVSGYFNGAVSEAASLIVCDVDHFKIINDTHGHDAGDVVLRDIGKILRTHARKDNIVGRIGGEEFVLILRDVGNLEAYRCAERLRLAIQAHEFSLQNGTLHITASFGVATVRPDDSWNSFYRRADARLYAAKRAGRNCTVANDATNSHLALLS